MRKQCEPEGPEPQVVRLLQWRARIVAVLRRSAYKDVAEDAADELICKMLRKARKGEDVPPCPVRVPKLSVWEVLRIAQSLSRESNVVELEYDSLPSPDNDGPAGTALTMMRRLEVEFAACELDNLLTAVRSGHCSHSDYAKAAGMSLRAFEYRLRNLRSAAPI
jgi:hypothetical protein